MVRKLAIILFMISLVPQTAAAQLNGSVADPDTTILLLSNLKVQIETNQAVNDMYNFKFESAEKQFRWIIQKYPDHPLGYFLMGLSEWWKIAPQVQNQEFDDTFYFYMDTTISISKKLYKNPNNKIEAAFFLAAAYGFKGRLLSERESWTRAAGAGKNALKYLEVSKGKPELSPELLFGDGLYNYYSVWIPENYPMLKPILMFFPKGDKEKGIDQLREVSQNAFYTRTEAQLFLMRILDAEGDRKGAILLAEYLYSTFPDNAYFHRYYTRMLYSTRKWLQVVPLAEIIIARIDSGAIGYEENSGRYAAFYLGQYHQSRGDVDSAKHYYDRAIAFGRVTEAFETGYYLHSLLNAGKIEFERGDKGIAKAHFKEIRKNSNRKHAANKRAKEYLKRY